MRKILLFLVLVLTSVALIGCKKDLNGKYSLNHDVELVYDVSEDEYNDIASEAITIWDNEIKATIKSVITVDTLSSSINISFDLTNNDPKFACQIEVKDNGKKHSNIEVYIKDGFYYSNISIDSNEAIKTKNKVMIDVDKDSLFALISLFYNQDYSFINIIKDIEFNNEKNGITIGKDKSNNVILERVTEENKERIVFIDNKLSYVSIVDKKNNINFYSEITYGDANISYPNFDSYNNFY